MNKGFRKARKVRSQKPAKPRLWKTSWADRCYGGTWEPIKPSYEEICDPTFRARGILVPMDGKVFLYDVTADEVFRMQRKNRPVNFKKLQFQKISGATKAQAKMVRRLVAKFL